MYSFGIDMPAFSPHRPLDFYAPALSDAEAAGFDTAWVGDHLLWHQPRFEAFSLLSAMTSLTSLRLGTAVALVALRPRWWTAKSVATVAALCRGGLIFGVGAGGEYMKEFELARVDRSSRGRIVDDAIDFCRDAWSGGLGTDFSPLPPSPIPIWIGGRSDRAIRRVAERGDGWLGLFLSAEAFRARVCQLDELAHVAGRPAVTHAMVVWIAVSLDGRTAKRVAAERIAAEYSMRAEKFDRYVVSGSPAEVVDSLGAYADAGADHIELHIAHGDFRGQVALLAGHVLPELLSRERPILDAPTSAVIPRYREVT